MKIKDQVLKAHPAGIGPYFPRLKFSGSCHYPHTLSFSIKIKMPLYIF